MAPKQFLGKPIPSSKVHAKKKRFGASPRIFALLILPIVVCGGLLALQRGTLEQAGAGERSTGNALGLLLADTTDACPPGTTNVNGICVTTGGTTTVDTSQFCNDTVVRSAFLTNDTTLTNIFPIIPNAINGKDQNGNDLDPATVNSATYCAPPYWTRAVVYLFIYKALAILNWVAEALAVILTIYAGVLYIAGAVSEKTVSTAKSVLIGTYGGLIIVFLAKTLVYSTINLVVSNNPYCLVGTTTNVAPPPVPGIGGTAAQSTSTDCTSKSSTSTSGSAK